jgi:hypothetical protein
LVRSKTALAMSRPFPSLHQNLLETTFADNACVKPNCCLAAAIIVLTN